MATVSTKYKEFATRLEEQVWPPIKHVVILSLQQILFLLLLTQMTGLKKLAEYVLPSWLAPVFRVEPVITTFFVLAVVSLVFMVGIYTVVEVLGGTIRALREEYRTKPDGHWYEYQPLFANFILFSGISMVWICTQITPAIMKHAFPEHPSWFILGIFPTTLVNSLKDLFSTFKDPIHLIEWADHQVIYLLALMFFIYFVVQVGIRITKLTLKRLRLVYEDWKTESR